MKTIAHKLDRIYTRVIENHPSVRFVILAVASSLTIILTYAGKFLNLRNDTGLTAIGWTITLFVILTQAIITSYDAYKKKYKTEKESEQLIHENAILKTLQSSFDELCDEKANGLLSLINKNDPDQYIVAEPKVQLKLLLKKLEITVSEMLSERSYRINSNEIKANLFYKFDNGNWFQINDHVGLIKKEEVVSGRSTFSFLINSSQRDIVFFTSKHKAFLEGKYMPEPADNRNKDDEIKGSIFGYKFARNINGKKIQVAIFCSTCNKQFIDESLITDEAVETMTYNIKNVILKNFEKRALIELATLYLEQNCEKTVAVV